MLANSLIFAGTGALIMALSVPLMLRRVPPNGGYGLRVPATLKDEGVWYDANAASGRDLFAFGALLVLLAFVPRAFGIGSPALEITWAVATLVGALVVAGVGWLRAIRMMRERRQEQRP